MDNTALLSALTFIRTQTNQMLDSLIAAVQADAGGVANPPPAVVGPPPATMGTVDPATGLLNGGRDVGGVRVDPVVAPGTPTTVTISETGHTVSVARPDKGEMFMGYCMRVSDQCHGNMSIVGGIIAAGETLFARWGGFKADGTNWPFAADFYFNRRAFLSPEEQAAEDAAAASWGGVHAGLSTPRP